MPSCAAPCATGPRLVAGGIALVREEATGTSEAAAVIGTAGVGPFFVAPWQSEAPSRKKIVSQNFIGEEFSSALVARGEGSISEPGKAMRLLRVESVAALRSTDLQFAY